MLVLRQHFDKLFWLLAASWTALGFLSYQTPGLPHPIWIMFGGIVAGTSVALARWRSMYAFKVHVITVVCYGVTRTILLTTQAENRIAVIAVWSIIIVKAVIISAMASYIIDHNYQDADGIDKPT